MLTCLLWPEQTHWNTYGCQSGRHFCRAVTKWTDSTICKSCSIRSWTEILPNRTWSTHHHMGVWTLSHIYLWSFIHCLYRPQTPNIHFLQHPLPTISTHWTLGFENATIRHDRHIQTRPWQPSWLSQPPSNAPTTKRQRTKNSRGI